MNAQAIESGSHITAGYIKIDGTIENKSHSTIGFIKSRFLLFPRERHWVLKPQNAQVWQSEFYKWLKETL